MCTRFRSIRHPTAGGAGRFHPAGGPPARHLWFAVLLLPPLLAAEPATTIPAAEGDTPGVQDLWTRPGEDWGAFLGPTGNGRSGLTDMAVPWPPKGPRIVWHCEVGQGYCAPAVALGRTLVFDRTGDAVRLRCLEAETGRPLWEQSYPTTYTDTFGYDGGPRAAPVIAGDRVLTYGPEGRLECRSLSDGRSLWMIDTAADYHVVQNFFGVGAAPLVVDCGRDRLAIVQVGGSPPGSRPPAPERLDLVKGLDSGLVAFDVATGRERWRSSSQLASYSGPVTAEIGGRSLVLAWMRDDFLAVDPATGNVLHAFRWRADELFSAVAASPVAVGDEVLLSETYGPGSVLLDLGGRGPDGGPAVVRRDRDNSRPTRSLKAHWGTPVHRDGHVYGSSGRHAGDALLVCADWKTGGITWSEPGLGRASVALVGSKEGDHLVVLGEFGDLVLAKASPARYTEVSRVRLVDPAVPDGGGELLTAPCWAAPVVAHGYLYVRGQGRLVCLDLLSR
jgi:outer membrane protein assembly factor BamB